jgi:hypothetical protein
MFQIQHLGGIRIMKHILNLAAALALLVSASQAHSQIFYNFSDGTSDGWANSGFGTTPAAAIQNIGGANYLNLPLGGFQVANTSSSDAANPAVFNAVMAAAAANPAAYNISYNYYINTAGFVGTTFLQVGTFVNSGSGYYAQDYGSPNELQLSGAQTGSGQIFQGTVSINMAAVGFNIPAADTFFRLGLIENANGTGVAVDITDISVSPVPEPATLLLLGLAMPAMWMVRRRRSA